MAGLICLSFGISSCGGGDSGKAEKSGVELTLGGDYPVVQDVTACVTEKDLEELQEFITANDEEGFKLKVAEKTANGTAFRLLEGTKVKLIDHASFGVVKVRVLDGSYKNQMGYFDTEFIKGFNN